MGAASCPCRTLKLTGPSVAVWSGRLQLNWQRSPVEVLHEPTLSFTVKPQSLEELVSIDPRLTAQEHELRAPCVPGCTLESGHQGSAHARATCRRKHDDILDHPVGLKAVHWVETDRQKSRAGYCAVESRDEEVIRGIFLQGGDPVGRNRDVAVAGHEQPVEGLDGRGISRLCPPDLHGWMIRCAEAPGKTNLVADVDDAQAGIAPGSTRRGQGGSAGTNWHIHGATIGVLLLSPPNRAWNVVSTNGVQLAVERA